MRKRDTKVQASLVFVAWSAFPSLRSTVGAFTWVRLNRVGERCDCACVVLNTHDLLLVECAFEGGHPCSLRLCIRKVNNMKVCARRLSVRKVNNKNVFVNARARRRRVKVKSAGQTKNCTCSSTYRVGRSPLFERRCWESPRNN